jgi:hypothetical protein
MSSCVKNILDSNFETCHQNMESSDFNKHIKTICQICKIDNITVRIIRQGFKNEKKGWFYLNVCLISKITYAKGFTLNYDKVSKEV